MTRKGFSNGQAACVILAGGRGTRMRSRDTHKACFPVAGKPAILRAMDAYDEVGIRNFVVVVGTMAGQVMETVGPAFPQTSFVYQPEQLGTGNATRVGTTPLQHIGFDGPVLVTMGDKILDAASVQKLVDVFVQQNLDMLLGTLPRQAGSSGGRVLLHQDGSLAGIVEKRDVERAASHALALQTAAQGKQESAATLEALIADSVTTTHDINQGKATASSLEEVRRTAGHITLGHLVFSPTEAEKAPLQNAAVYLFKAPALYEALKHMTTNNAQHEEYLTDAVNHLANAVNVDGSRQYKVGYYVLEPDSVLTYNNPEELLEVEERFKRRLQNISVEEPPALPESQYRSVTDWLAMLDQGGAGVEQALCVMYGSDGNLATERVAVYRDVLKKFGELHGFDRRVVLVRAPGRVNLMGRHIEHRGGHVNVMAINKETVLVAAPREDDVVRIANADSVRYPDAEFRIGREITDLPWDDWLNYINHEHVQQLVMESKGDWTNYVKAAFLRLQFQFKDARVHGMDAVYSGNIPLAAGLSSSSSLVVSTAEVAAALNGLDVSPQDFVDLCGEGEWYVGSRGGAGDHAAMKFSQRGVITQIGFFPFGVRGSVPFPQDYRLVVANSHVKAQKSTNAKDTFNQRVASYEFGLMMLRERYPHLAERMQRLRDLRPTTLGIKPSDFYNMLLSLPEMVTREQVLVELAPKFGPTIERILASHVEPPEYLLRSVVLYGVAECERAVMCLDYLNRDDIAGLGRLMQISHNGDRVVRYTRQGQRWESAPYDYLASDEYLRGLIADLRSEDPDRVGRAQLHMQPGGYACSTPEIDLIVDTALSVPGVVGAQISGAGLGGCTMMLVQQDAVEALTEALEEHYYAPNHLVPDVMVCVPVKGSGLIRIE